MKTWQLVVNLTESAAGALADIAERCMQLQCLIQDGTISITNGKRCIMIEPQQWQVSEAMA